MLVHALVSVLAAWSIAPARAKRIRFSISIPAYEEHILKFGIKRDRSDATGYNARVALFEQRREAVRRHNAQPGIMWRAAVNHFADHTEDEFRALLGHRPHRRMKAVAAREASLDKQASEVGPGDQLAQSMDWGLLLNNSGVTAAKDQGNCGSCWAVAAVGALETHAAIHMEGRPVPKISHEQLLDCVQNPNECGGQGGCSGATSELALRYTQEQGLLAESEYRSEESKAWYGCKPPNPIITMASFVESNTNELHILMEGVARKGPVVVSADASQWSTYSSGVFDGCDKDAIVNHALLCMGYGRDEELKSDYWLIRNSWGPFWGELGYIRLLRHTTADEWCGTDTAPQLGSGCKDGPESLRVCGMCGVLSGIAYPQGVKIIRGEVPVSAA